MYTWDSLVDFHQTLSQRPRQIYARHAQLMLDLIPLLENHPAFKTVQPGAAHATLFLAVDSDKVVHVWADMSGSCEIYLLKNGDEVTDKITVSLKDAVSTLEGYLKRLALVHTTPL